MADSASFFACLVNDCSVPHRLFHVQSCSRQPCRLLPKVHERIHSLPHRTCSSVNSMQPSVVLTRHATCCAASKFRIALCQMLVGTNKTENLKRAKKLVEDAAKAGAKIVVLPVSHVTVLSTFSISFCFANGIGLQVSFYPLREHPRVSAQSSCECGVVGQLTFA